MKKNEKIIIGVLALVLIITVGTLTLTKKSVSKIEKRADKQSAKQSQDVEEDLNEDYSLEKAIQNGYFVITHNKVYNKEKLNRFIENTGMNSKNRIEDSIKIVQYTVEGDPIVTELSYKIKDETYLLSGKPVNKTNYILKLDNTRDKWSVKEDRKVTVNEDIPGNIYGIKETKNGDTINVELVLYAEIDYIDENAKRYETINVCSYSNDAEQETGISFYGKVIEANQKYILVEPNEGEEIRKSADKIEISLGENNDALYSVGTNLKITYTGMVMETYPAKIEATNIEIKSINGL